MKNLLTIATKMVARLFHAFVQDRLKAEMSDPELILMRSSQSVESHLNECMACEEMVRELEREAFEAFALLRQEQEFHLDNNRFDVDYEKLIGQRLRIRNNGDATFLNDTSNKRTGDTSDYQRTLDGTGSPFEPVPELGISPQSVSIPKNIGRYRVEKQLGEGGFGRVYLAHDDELGRLVSIKVSHRSRISRSEDAEAYVAEARTLAALDHPAVVPVYDVGRTEDGLCYVVCKFIQGSDLAARIKQGRPAYKESAELIATVAEALHYAHKRGLVHRDVKPDNILLDSDGKPFIADFGLALKNEDFGKGPGYAGTPRYMSPEQARGEAHRVDGRSDVFSLGAVLYELLTGNRPYHGDSVAEILDQIVSGDVRPPRRIDERIPYELERICLKAMSKRASDRYTTAHDLAEDLRHFLLSIDSGTKRQRNPGKSQAAPVRWAEFSHSDLPLIGVL